MGDAVSLKVVWIVFAILSFGSQEALFSQLGNPCPVGDPSVAEYRELSEFEQIELLESYRLGFVEALEEARDSLEPQIHGTPILLEARLKTTESLKEKISRPQKNYSCFSELTDIAGLRLVIPDYAALPYAEKLIRKSFQVLSEENLLLAERGSGYRAIHYLVAVEGKTAEIQLQTLRGLLWADVSHNLCYKGPFRGNQQLGQYLHELSDVIYLLDSGFSAELPTPPATLPTTAKDALERTVGQIGKVGRADPDRRFLIIEHDEDESGRDLHYLRLTIPLAFPSDYFSLDEFRDLGFQNHTSH
jgi:ppGpp synthetase/RelA/SpoT-type nucleotidyltranferase